MFFWAFLCFFFSTTTAAPMEGSEEFSADHRSLENERGIGICFFFCFTLVLWRLPDRMSRVLKETDTERTNVHMPYRMKPMIQRRFTLLYNCALCAGWTVPSCSYLMLA